MEQNAKIIEQFTNALADLDGKIERFKNTRENAKLDNETKDSLDEVIAKLEEDKATIELIITKMEKFAIMNESSDLLACGIYQYAWIPPEIFNDEIIKSLKILNYTKCHNLLSKGNSFFEIFTEADELGIFLRQFSDTI